MKARLLPRLACPECGGDLALDARLRWAAEIVEGILTCAACARRYPIIGAVPRLLPDALMGTLARYHRDFFARHGLAQPAHEQERDAVARTLSFYSFARPKLFSPTIQPEMLAYWQRSLAIRIPAVSQLAGQFGLDAGCGEGRYTYCLAREAAEVVGLDLSEAVNQAYRRNRAYPHVHIVQGSIYQPPFRRGIFDFVVSTGVLHHLPDPEGGFAALVPLVRAGGTVHIWVYGLRRMSLVYRLSHLTLLHRLLSRLSPRASYLVGTPIALALHLLVFRPLRVLARGEAAGARVHPQLRELAALPFQVHRVEVQDRIGVPVTNYLTDGDVRGWFERAGLAQIEVLQTGGGRGWSARGTRFDTRA